ncbi:MAG TPA: sugar phosphate isomerase/epimerase [Bryobacteraceae bacterium]|nr:sugar phosphate isomerase/epimerase [Bryobacteraceae bacterium]
MNHVLSTHLFVNHRLTTVWLDRIWSAGIPAVEIFCARQHLDWHNKAQVGELSAWFRDSQLRLHSLHSPMYTDEVWGRSGPQASIDITEPVKARRIANVDEIRRAVEIAETVPFRYLIQHIGAGGAEYDERRVEAAFTSLEEITVFARQRGVEVLLENIPNEFSTAAMLNLFLDQTHLDLNYCFDIGHANLGGGVESEYNAMKTRIRSTHLHDNDGKSDSHLFPFGDHNGTVEWQTAIPMLASRPEQYPLVLELKEQPDQALPFDAARQIFDRMESIAMKESLQ